MPVVDLEALRTARTQRQKSAGAATSLDLAGLQRARLQRAVVPNLGLSQLIADPTGMTMRTFSEPPLPSIAERILPVQTFARVERPTPPMGEIVPGGLPPERGFAARLFVPGTELPPWDKSTPGEKAEKILKIATGIPAHIASGLASIVTEPAWAAYKAAQPNAIPDEYKDLTFAQAVDRAAGSEPSGFENILRGVAEFVGPGKVVEQGFKHLAGGTIPKAASKIIEGAKVWGTTEAGLQVSKGLAQAIEPGQAQYGYEGAARVAESAAMGGAFGGIEGLKLPWTAKKAAEAATFAAQSAARGGSTEDIFTAAAIPVLFSTPALAGRFFAGLDSPKAIELRRPPEGAKMTPEQFRTWAHQQARTEAREAARAAAANPNDAEAQARWRQVRGK